MKFRLLSLALLVVIAFAACKSSTVDFAYEYKNLEFVFEAPYAGSESKSAEVSLNLDSAFKANNADIAKIDKVTLDNVSFEMQDGQNFDNFSNLTVEFQSDNADVKTITVGSINDIKKGEQKIAFAGSEKQNADDFFNQKKFNILLSSNLKPEDTLSYKIKGMLRFKVKAGAAK